MAWEASVTGQGFCGPGKIGFNRIQETATTTERATAERIQEIKDEVFGCVGRVERGDLPSDTEDTALD